MVWLYRVNFKLYKYNNEREVFVTKSEIDTVIVNRKQLISEVIEGMRQVNDEEYFIENLNNSKRDEILQSVGESIGFIV